MTSSPLRHENLQLVLCHIYYNTFLLNDALFITFLSIKYNLNAMSLCNRSDALHIYAQKLKKAGPKMSNLQ